ncbi:histone H1-like [Archocentrus centrarchus]|uniref:histone H1-like n=1 Tax=Archocentrus centrarchus TaxID=63155 RepID=UPI0011E9C309|nr:histone H1-like [Archocentrus centrarchus]XP_030576428.1 histone H1-like [Archocentrus centrarchus]
MTGPAAEAPGGSDTPAKAPKKRKKKGGPAVSELVYRAVAASQDRKGLSYYAIKKALSFQGYDVEQYGFLVKRAINMLVKKGALIQTKGSGVSGSFKVPKPAKKPSRRRRNPRWEKYPRLRKAAEAGEDAEEAR